MQQLDFHLELAAQPEISKEFQLEISVDLYYYF